MSSIIVHLAPFTPLELVSHLKSICSNPVLKAGDCRVTVSYSYKKTVAEVVALKGMDRNSEDWSSHVDRLRTAIGSQLVA